MARKFYYFLYITTTCNFITTPVSVSLKVIEWTNRRFGKIVQYETRSDFARKEVEFFEQRILDPSTRCMEILERDGNYIIDWINHIVFNTFVICSLKKKEHFGQPSNLKSWKVSFSYLWSQSLFYRRFGCLYFQVTRPYGYSFCWLTNQLKIFNVVHCFLFLFFTEAYLHWHRKIIYNISGFELGKEDSKAVTLTL